jgi:hypothetical protein
LIVADGRTGWLIGPDEEDALVDGLVMAASLGPMVISPRGGRPLESDTDTIGSVRCSADGGALGIGADVRVLG